MLLHPSLVVRPVLTKSKTHSFSPFFPLPLFHLFFFFSYSLAFGVTGDLQCLKRSSVALDRIPPGRPAQSICVGANEREKKGAAITNDTETQVRTQAKETETEPLVASPSDRDEKRVKVQRGKKKVKKNAFCLFVLGARFVHKKRAMRFASSVASSSPVANKQWT